ncbi:MAG: hypothetical protein WCQ53_08395, partial [bacterium]
MADSEKRKKVLLITVIIAIVLGASVFAYTKYDAYVKAHNKVTDGPAVSVLVIEVPKKDVPLVKEWVGTTQGDVNTDIYAKISGYLLKMNYSEGTVVQ